jgi:hypothetical protein
MRCDAEDPTMSPPLPLTGLEAFYDELAEAVDRAGDRRELLLAKLALLLAHEVGDLARVRALIRTAETDL